MHSIIKHHIRVFLSDGSSTGFFDEFDLGNFDNDLDLFFDWYNPILNSLRFSLDGYELFDSTGSCVESVVLYEQ